MVDLIVEWASSARLTSRQFLGVGLSGKVEIDFAPGDQVN
jgi:hypothetical protein